MKVEFLVNDRRYIFITEAEFRKSKHDEEEYNSFAFANESVSIDEKQTLKTVN